MCQWTGKKGTCVARSSAGFACTKQSDCGGTMRCCEGPDWRTDTETTECRNTCAPGQLEFEICASAADCRPIMTYGATGGLMQAACKRTEPKLADEPPWMKTCVATQTQF